MTASRRKVATLAPLDLLLLRQALLSVVLVRLALWLVPWRHLAGSIDVAPENAPGTRPTVDRVVWAIAAASRYIPRATCLTRALALHRLLSKHGYDSIVQIGVSKDGGRFDAHAWVEHDGGPLLTTSDDVARYSRFFTWPQSRLDLP